MTEPTLPPLALSVRQPWAWAIMHGRKDIENRSPFAVRTMTRGPLAIHAAKGMTRDEYEEARAFILPLVGDCPRPDELTRGAIIGQVTVIEIVSDHASPWFFGPRGLVLRDPEPVEPIPAKGELGYFRWQSSGGITAPATPWMRAWGR